MAVDPRKKILVVDDDSKNREYLVALLKAEGYATLEAGNGETALQFAEQQLPDLILLDAMMPGMDGFHVADQLKKLEATKSIPVIMVTALTDRSSKLRGLNCGVEEFLTKPVDRAELWIRVRNLLRLKEYNDFLSNYNTLLEQQVKERSEQLLSSHFDTIFTIMRAAEFRDEETGAHIKRISYYSKELALQLGMGQEFAETIYHASPLHDVGKIGIPDHILLKPGLHEPHEWEIMKTHTTLGAAILGMEKSNSSYARMGSVIALGHHEKWSGGGYPNGLTGERIPLPARIMAICDVYDALRSKRPYKPPFTHEQSVRIILEGDDRTSPRDFDPQVLEAFRMRTLIFNEIFESHAD
jgi:putative two-component system response regulator